MKEFCIECSCCKEPYVHILKVEVYEGSAGLRMLMKRKKRHSKISYKIDHNTTNNPGYDDRPGILIHLGCEMCSHITVVAFSEHKGLLTLRARLTREYSLGVKLNNVGESI